MRPLAHASRPQPLLGVSTGVQQLGAFSLVELTGAFIQPLRMLLRQTQINVTSPPCGSWALPSGQRKGEQTWKLCHGSVSLDKREQLSVLSTGVIHRRLSDA